MTLENRSHLRFEIILELSQMLISFSLGQFMPGHIINLEFQKSWKFVSKWQNRKYSPQIKHAEESPSRAEGSELQPAEQF